MNSQKKLLYLSRQEVESVNLSMKEIMDMMVTLSLEKDGGYIEVPPKKWLHPEKDNSFFSSMPCQFTRLGLAGCKWQSGFPTNKALNLPYIVGLIILNDINNGYPLAIMDSSWIVGMRTAATSAVGAKFLANKKSKSIAVLGCGVQGKAHVQAMLEVLPEINEIRAYDINSETMNDYVNNISKYYKIHCIPTKSPVEAASGADIIVTAGVISKSSLGILETTVLKPGVFACPVDYDSYWKKDALMSFDKIYTDDLVTLNDHREDGYFSSLPDNLPELASLVAGKTLGRENDDEKILFMNIGIGPSDVIVANRVFEIACKKSIGKWLSV